MHFQFLIEDQSSAVLMEILMKKIMLSNPNITYDCKSFKGIGGFTKKNTLKETKSGKLLNDLATYLRGFNKSLQHIRAAIIVVLDNDDRDIDAFSSELESVAVYNKITIDHVFCIAVEEVEAWLLGDEKALLAASIAILRYFKEKGSLVMVASHDLELARELDGDYENYYFCDTVKDKDVVFDYRLRKGICSSHNAIRLLVSMVFPETITNEAKGRCS